MANKGVLSVPSSRIYERKITVAHKKSYSL